MQFELLTLSGAKFKGEADEVTLTTTEGQMGVLPHHEPFIGEVVAGAVTIKHGKGAPEVFATYGGLLEITADYVRLMADEADHEAGEGSTEPTGLASQHRHRHLDDEQREA